MKRRKVIWSPRALAEFGELYGYLVNKWGVNTAESVLEKIEVNLILASRMPYVFPKHHKFNQRFFIINGRTKVYYRFRRTKLEVVAFYGTRQDEESYQ